MSARAGSAPPRLSMSAFLTGNARQLISGAWWSFRLFGEKAQSLNGSLVQQRGHKALQRDESLNNQVCCGVLVPRIGGSRQDILGRQRADLLNHILSILLGFQ